MIKLFRDTDIGGSLSGGPDPIPEDVMKKIEAIAENLTYGLRDKPVTKEIEKGHCLNLLTQGYSLSLPTIQAQEERIRVLEEALRTIRDGGYTGAYMIAHEALIKAKALTLNL